jgi:hypothetical protein
MLFHTQHPTLIRRTNDLSKNGVEPATLIARWFAGQRKRPVVSKLTPAVKAALKIAGKQDLTSPYLFRPFVHGTVLNNDQLFGALSLTKGGGVRARPEIRAAFGSGAIGIAVAPAPSDLGATLTRFTCFSWSLPDNDIAARGNAMIYCDQFPERDAEDKSILVENVNGAVKSLFGFSLTPLKAAIFYTYAVLSSSEYLEMFEGVLYAPSNPSEPPRIPISSEINIRQQLANLGEKIAECERPNHISPILPSLSINWPPGLTELKLVSWDYVESSGQLSLVGENGESLTFANVPQHTVSLRIAGHNVVEKWVRERHFSYLRPRK